MFGNTIVNTLRYNARTRSGRTLSSRLEVYFSATSRNGNSNLIPKNAHTIRVSNVIKIGGVMSQNVYSMLLTYRDGVTTRRLNIVLKTYHPQNIDPILKAYIHNEDLRRYLREFQTLRSLKRVGFPVPEVYLCECDSSFIGNPFIIMQKEDFVQKSTNELDSFAATLAHLHNLRVSELGIDALKSPEDGYAFARRWPIHFKHYLNLETKHDKRIKKKFDLAIRWLNSNAPKNYCPQYCLIHGDYHPANVYSTKDYRMMVLDWESVEIGDPAFDVGYAYHFIKFFSDPKNPNSAERVAERFISEYSRNFQGDISRRLEFYKMVAILGVSIYYSSGLSSFIKAYRYHQRKVLQTIPFLGGLFIFLGFPFIRWPYVARQLGALDDVYWLRYFENFLESTVKL
jgi:aminoglycoside phosphotransferase (APT) family kinase protein